uniref:NADH-ubiquinone oxidoreductase chain 2 n=1 Tax=Argonauta nodosus TaxID=2718171 RepID=A0A6M2RJ98_9MOLL|nr:NADH dehydrogenase subunit 2 [Argonauta nodosus]QCI56221.1 NADH dehydrogenase subunit 2 [Argonauta nodosus]
MNNKFFPSNFMMIMMMFMGSIMTMSSSHWMMMWMGLELNLMGILPLMNIKSKNLEIESSMKYFIIQSLSSSLFFLSSMFMFLYSLNMYIMLSNSTFSSIMMVSLLIKVGSVPFHFWLPSMCKFLSWSILYFILTWQKLAPLYMLSLINSNFYIMIVSSISSSIIGSIQAINQTNLQMIMTYSSISHLGWMIPAASINNSMMMFYLFMYSIIIIPLFNFFSSFSTNFLYSLSEQTYMNNNQNILISALLLSLGGLPPSLGFISKLMIINMMVYMNMILLPLILFLGTIISLYFYLNMTMMILIKSYSIFLSPIMKIKMKLFLVMNMMGSLIFIPMLIYAMNIFYKS